MDLSNLILNDTSEDWKINGNTIYCKKIIYLPICYVEDDIFYIYLDKRIINFRYYNTKGEKDDRIVEPLKIWFKEKAWYLFAYCHTKKDIRQFKINRIKELVLTERNFERSIEEFNINNKNDKLNGVKIKVEIDKSQAYRVYDEFCEENIIKKENGDFEVLMENYENDWLYGYLLSYGEHLRILEPERIKNIILEKIVKIKYKYEK